MDAWIRTAVGLGTVVAVVGVPLVLVLVVTGRWNPMKALLGHHPWPRNCSVSLL